MVPYCAVDLPRNKRDGSSTTYIYGIGLMTSREILGRRGSH